jgi:hypothetical protein
MIIREVKITKLSKHIIPITYKLFTGDAIEGS